MNESDLELYGIVGKMFREIREHKGLSLEVCATYLNIAPKSLQRYECGERKIKIGTIKQLCEFYKINYDDFINEAKLQFGKNVYNSVYSIDKKPAIIQYYDLLNKTGKNEATKRVRELTFIPEYITKHNEETSIENIIDVATAKKYIRKHNAAAFNGIDKMEDTAIIEMANTIKNTIGNKEN